MSTAVFPPSALSVIVLVNTHSGWTHQKCILVLLTLVMLKRTVLSAKTTSVSALGLHVKYKLYSTGTGAVMAMVVMVLMHDDFGFLFAS